MVSRETMPFMDPTAGIAYRSAEAGEEAIRFSQEIRHLMAVPQESASSFTALLELPATQAMDLLHMSEPGKSPGASLSGDDIDPRRIQSYGRLTFPSNPVLMDRAARFSIAAKEQIGDVSPESSSIPSNSCRNLDKVKPEPGETESSLPSVPDPAVNNQDQCQSNQNNRSGKRKEREKVKSSGKKIKTPEDADKLPYVHVRARRGQATDSHSLAERARREKINARMKLLQDIVPGCNKIQGTAMVLDEIINHVQSLQRQVEVLSMRLATVNPIIDFTLDPTLSADQRGSLMDSSFSGTLAPMTWPEVSGNRQIFQHLPQWPFDAFQNPVLGRGEDNYHNFIPSENSLSSYVSSATLSLTVFQTLTKHLTLLQVICVRTR